MHVFVYLPDPLSEEEEEVFTPCSDNPQQHIRVNTGLGVLD